MDAGNRCTDRKIFAEMETEMKQEYVLNQLKTLIGIDSPTGYYENVQNYLMKELEGMGFRPKHLRKGGVIVELGGEGNPLMMLSHVWIPSGVSFII